MSKIIRCDAEGVEIEQGSEAWKQLRIGLVTGSMIEGIVARQKKDPTKYLDSRATAVMSIVGERLTGQPDIFFPSKYMKDGIKREPFARMWLEEKTGWVIEEVAFIQHDWMKVGISPDGMIIGQKRLAEFKCPKDTTHLEYLKYTTYPKSGIYYAQMQSQLWLAEYEVCNFTTFHPHFINEGLQGHTIEVPRDEPFIKMLEEEVGIFLSEVNVLVKEYEQLGNSRKAIA